MKKTNKFGLFLVVFGIIFTISALSFLSKGQYSTVIIGAAFGLLLVFVGVRRIKNPPPSKEEIRAEQAAAEEAARIEQEKAINRAENEKIETFKSIIASIPASEIVLNTTPLQRQFLKDMPEIKTSNISKTFNPSSLPAFVVIDTETTGLKASSDRIIELSAILYEDFCPVSSWSTRIKIDQPIPSDASAINGIHDEDLVDAPYIDDVAESFKDFVGSVPIVGYNISFDLKFLFCSGIDLVSSKQKKYDVLTLARRQYKNEIYDGFSLENVCHHNGIFYVPHQSLSDCYATGNLFKLIIEERTDSFIP